MIETMKKEEYVKLRTDLDKLTDGIGDRVALAFTLIQAAYRTYPEAKDLKSMIDHVIRHEKEYE